MVSPIVFFDIAGPDIAALRNFYSKVFGWDIAGDGRIAPFAVSSIGATLRQDPADKLIYIGVEDIAATLKAVEVHGGSIDAPRFEVKGVVVLGLFRDTAGNHMGLVELADGKPKIP
jgi:uncharacterized protein